MPRFTDRDIEDRYGANYTEGKIYKDTTIPEQVTQRDVPAAVQPPPKIFDDAKITGLMQTFGSLVKKAEGAKYARTAEMYKGLSSVVGQMIGFASAERQGDTGVASSNRGQDITAQEGIAKLGIMGAQHAETSRYHEGMLSKMAEELGMKREEFGLAEKRYGLEEKKLGETTRLAERGLELEEKKIDETSAGVLMKGLQSEVGGLNKMRTSALMKSAAKEKEAPAMKSHWWGADTPNTAMETQTAIEGAYQSGLKDVMQRYGVTMAGGTASPGASSTDQPYWKKVLEGEY